MRLFNDVIHCFYIFAFLFIALGCENVANKEFPLLSKNGEQWLAINGNLSISGQISNSRGFSGSSSISDEETGRKTFDMDWANSTWDNNRNKPKIYYTIKHSDGEVKPITLVPENKYEYRKKQGNSSPSIRFKSFVIPYKEKSDTIVLYILDKGTELNENRVVINQPNTLYPLGDNRNDYKFIFKSSKNGLDILVSDIINKKSGNSFSGITFNPIGTMILLDLKQSNNSDIEWIGGTLSIVLSSNCVVLGNCYMNVFTGRVDRIGQSYLRLNLYNDINRNDKTKTPIYGLYCFGLTKQGIINASCQSINLNHSKLLTFDFLNKYNGKSLSCRFDIKEEHKYFVTKWIPSSESISFEASFDDNKYNIQYKKEGDIYWITHPKPKKINKITSFKIKNLDSGSSYLIRMFGLKQIKIHTEELKEIKQWGQVRWTSMYEAFSNCNAMDVTATDIPNFEREITLNKMFYNCSSLQNNNGSIESWVVSNVNNSKSTFEKCTIFSRDLSLWRLGNISRNKMFEGCPLKNDIQKQPIFE